MIQRLTAITLFVADQDEAQDSDIHKLGLKFVWTRRWATFDGSR
jgi:hypothetical protein